MEFYIQNLFNYQPQTWSYKGCSCNVDQKCNSGTTKAKNTSDNTRQTQQAFSSLRMERWQGTAQHNNKAVAQNASKINN